MGLPENTQYGKNYSQALKAISSKGIKGVGSSIAKPKKFADTSRFSNLANNVSSNAQAPSNLRLGQVTTPYGGSTNYEKFHPGLDVANKMGTQIPSFSAGRVTNVIRGKRQGDPGYGNYVIITDNQGNKHRYSHLSNSYVKIGDPIKRGQFIGGMGSSGQAYSATGGDASHLDYRIKSIYDKYINPYKFITG